MFIELQSSVPAGTRIKTINQLTCGKVSAVITAGTADLTQFSVGDCALSQTMGPGSIYALHVSIYSVFKRKTHLISLVNFHGNVPRYSSTQTGLPPPKSHVLY